MSRVLLSAGDASGEAHAAELVAALRPHLPGVEFLGLGGTAMEAAGVEIRVPQRDLAIGGLVEVLGALSRVVRAWREMDRLAREETPELAILVDSPDFNLPLARRLRRRGVPILYYISPQVWAWRTGRVRKLARRVDRMAVIFPFEVDVYAGTGLRVDFVGHPLVERMRDIRARHDRAALRAEWSSGGPLVVLLPGSRENEIRDGLGLQLESARHLHARVADAHFVLALAPTVTPSDVKPYLDAAGLPAALSLQVVEGRTCEAILAADLALATPGTVTVEATLLGCALVVAGRGHPLSAAIMRRMLHVPSFTMPNLIAGEPIVPEFLQEQADPEAIAAGMAELLHGPVRERQLARLGDVAQRLGSGGAAERSAAIALEMIRERAAAA